MTMVLSAALTAAPPSADIGVTSLPAGTTSLRVSRVLQSGSSVIRSRATIAGTTGHVIDFDAPTGRPVSWQIDALSSGGGVLETAVTTSQTLQSAPEGWAWLMDPMAPRSAMLVQTLLGSDDKRDYLAQVKASVRMGSSLPRAIGSTRQAPTVSLEWTTVSTADALAMEDLLSAGGVLLLRASPTTIRHRTGVLNIGAPAVHALSATPAEFVDWAAEGFECAGVEIPPVVYVWTYADLKAMGGTYADLKARYAGRNYLALARGQ